MSGLPQLSPAMSFDQACNAVVSYLKDAVPLGMWGVIRHEGAGHTILSVIDDAYCASAGTSLLWSGSLCKEMIGGAPTVAPDTKAVAAYRTACAGQAWEIGTYAGVPITRPDGRVFGSLCGMDPAVHADPAGLRSHEPLLNLLGTLLSTVLEADTARTAAERLAERTLLEAESDAMTGLLNRRGWDRYLAAEEDRYKRFGDPGSVVVLDLDRLKEVNDGLGHDAGDQYIRLAANTLRDTVRSTDVVARLGGDEFGVVAANTSPEDTQSLVVRLAEALRAARVSGSFGHAPYTIGSGFPGAWKAADEAMYAQKALHAARLSPPVR